MTRRNTVSLLIIALIVASVLRLWRLDSVPPGFYHDEAYNALDALSLLEGRTFPQFYEGWELYRTEAHGERGPFETRTPLFFEGNYGREPLHVYLMALSISIFGATPVAARLVPALGGILAVVTTAWAASILAPRERRREVAVFSAFAVAILFPAIHFSRFGLRAMLFVPVETLCIAFFWRGLQQQSQRRDLILAGILLGGGLYVYASARMMPLLFVCFCAWYLWRRANWRGNFGRFTLIATVATLIALPMLLYFAAYPYFLFFRSAYVAQHGAGVVEGRPWLTALLNGGRILRGFIWQGETHLRHNLPGRPYFDALQLALFGLGIVSLRKWATPQRVFIVLWGIVMLLPSILSGDAPHFGRLTGFVPVAALLIGNGATTLWLNLQQRRSPQFATAALGLILSLSTCWTGFDYFVRYAQHPQIAADFYLPDRQLGEWLATLPNDGDLYLTPARQQLATILFALGSDRARLHNYTGASGIILYGKTDAPAYHIVADSEQATIERLDTFTHPIENPIAGWLARRANPVLFQAHPDSVGTAIEIEAQVMSGETETHVTLRWQPQTTLDANWTAFVHLLDADGQLLAQNDRPPAGYPTSDWQVNEIIEDLFIVPASLCIDCQLVTGFYLAETGERLGQTVQIR
ncbi:MAG: ArnT family glycosyltransferase [Candidatus Promineifilaceae bacterium]